MLNKRILLFIGFAGLAIGAELLHSVNAVEPAEDLTSAEQPRDPVFIRFELDVARKQLELIKGEANLDQRRDALAEIERHHRAAMDAHIQAELAAIPEPEYPAELLLPLREDSSDLEFLEKGEQFLGELAFACNRGATTPEELDDAREALAELMESDAVIGLCEEMQLAWETVEAEAKEQQLLTTSSSDLQENLPNVQAQILDPLVANSLEKLEKARKAATASWEGRKEEPSLEEKRNSLAELDPILAELHRNQAKVEAKGRLKDAQTRITELEVELNKAVSQ